MLIDPARFLTLTAMLAGACTRQPEAGVPKPTDDELAERAAMGSSLPEESAEAVQWGRGDVREDDPESSDGTGAADGACDDAQANPGDCNAIRIPRTGPHCEGGASIVQDCQILKEQFRPKVAERFVACLLAKNGTRQLCSEGVSACENQAVAQACVPPVVRDQCAEILSACHNPELPEPTDEGYTGPPMPPETCHHALAAIRAEYTPHLTECMSHLCSETAAAYCRYRLRYVARSGSTNLSR